MLLRPLLCFALCFTFALIAAAAQAAPAAPARVPAPPLFEQALPNLPGQILRVDRLTLGDGSIPAHRHSGSVYIYVLEGAAVLQIEGQPETIVRTGESFFEPAGVLHMVARSAEPGTPAIALAVSISPEGQPLGVFDQ